MIKLLCNNVELVILLIDQELRFKLTYLSKLQSTCTIGVREVGFNDAPIYKPDIKELIVSAIKLFIINLIVESLIVSPPFTQHLGKLFTKS